MSTARMPTRLGAETCGLLIIDWQTRLAAAMSPEGQARVQQAQHLCFLAAQLGVPVVATEQYPRGLGPTVEELREMLPEDAVVLPKTRFSVWGDEAIQAAIRGAGRRQWIVVGMEAHICVYQSVADLCAAGLEVVVVEDAVVSRTEANRAAGLRLCAAAGATVSVTEAVLFELLVEGRGDLFKQISQRIK